MTGTRAHMLGPRTRRFDPDTAPTRWSRLARSDWVLWPAVASLLLIGVLLVAAATRPTNKLHPYATAEKDVLNIVIGIALCLLIAVVDYRALRAFAPIAYVLAVLGLLATFVIGSTINGSRSWISLGGGFEVQPSEFAKIAVIVVVATLFSRHRDDDAAGPGDLDVLKALSVVGIPMLLTVLEPDLGNVLVLLALMFGLFAVGGAPTRWMLGLCVLLIAGTVVVLKGHLLHSYQQQRLTSFLSPNANHSSIGYNAYEARLAIGSGGMTGTGLFHGSQINNGYVFAAHTDFIFATAGEELGFAGSAAIIGLVTVVLWRGLRIAAHCQDMFGRVIAAGVVCWFAFQAFENIGMSLGIMPVTGIPLEFISYGGSATFANMLAVGLLHNVHIHTKSEFIGSR
jgi:rod shape determining protein RodA